MARTTLLTIDDFERLPDEQAKDHELVDGPCQGTSGRSNQARSTSSPSPSPKYFNASNKSKLADASLTRER